MVRNIQEIVVPSYTTRIALRYKPCSRYVSKQLSYCGPNEVTNSFALAVPFMWYGLNGKLAGDMARMHTCSDYNAIRSFVMEHGVLEGETEGILKPPPGAFITDLRN